MKKVLILIVALLLFQSCIKEILERRSGELCFTVKEGKLMVSNQTKKVMHFDAIDSKIVPLILRIPFDCKNFNILDPEETITFELDSLLKDGRNPLSITWWQCKNNKVVDTHQTTLPTASDNQFCSKAD